MHLKKLFTTCMILFAAACATSPLGRKQFIIVPESQVDQMGAQAFQQIEAQENVILDPETVQYIKCIVEPLTRAAKDQTSVKKWDVKVFNKKEANAFALPGGKIGVYTGILNVAKNDAQLAAVIGHEIGHVIAHHGAERISEQAGTQLGLAALGVITANNPNRDLLIGLLGMGTQVGIILPFSRTQEAEADLIGLDLMARAGFDPEQSIAMWHGMIASSGGRAPPEWLSTHPASENRIASLQEHMPEALVKFEKARAEGKTPVCSKPGKLSLNRNDFNDLRDGLAQPSFNPHFKSRS